MEAPEPAKVLEAEAQEMAREQEPAKAQEAEMQEMAKA